MRIVFCTLLTNRTAMEREVIMKKMLEKSVGAILCVVILLGLLTSAVGIDNTSVETSAYAAVLAEQISSVTIQTNPFAMIYDSNEVFVEKAEYILRRTKMENTGMSEAAQTEKSSGAFF